MIFSRLAIYALTSAEGRQSYFLEKVMAEAKAPSKASQQEQVYSFYFIFIVLRIYLCGYLGNTRHANVRALATDIFGRAYRRLSVEYISMRYLSYWHRMPCISISQYDTDSPPHHGRAQHRAKWHFVWRLSSRHFIRRSTPSPSMLEFVTHQFLPCRLFSSSYAALMQRSSWKCPLRHFGKGLYFIFLAKIR